MLWLLAEILDLDRKQEGQMEDVKISNGPHNPRLYDGTTAVNGDVTTPSNGDVFTRTEDDVVEILDAPKGPGDPRRETWGGKVGASTD